MKFEVELSYIDSNRVVVLAKAYENDVCLGSSLGEGKTVDEAEHIACDKLNLRILNKSKKNTYNQNHNQPENLIKIPLSTKDEKFDTKSKSPKINQDEIESINKKSKDPIDWSSELTAIDYEIKRLGWNKEQEDNFIKRTLGYNNRSRITNYNDIKSLITKLKQIDINTHNKLNKQDLIRKSDSLIEKLNWKSSQGRDYLQKKFNVLSRNDLNIEQLVEFNNMLDSEYRR